MEKIKTPAHAWLEWAKELRSMAEIGLTYSKDQYEIERCKRMREISHAMIGDYFHRPQKEIAQYFDQALSYPTPKIDVRVAIFQEDKILLVKETRDGKWALPGGWCDVGTSPSEAAKQEAAQEAGLIIEIKRLLALWDKAKHPHPPHPDYTYKIVFEAMAIGACPTDGHETDGVDYFSRDNLPPLSLPRILPSQIKRIFALSQGGLPPDFD